MCVFSPPLRLGRPSKRQKQEGKQEEANYRGQESSFMAVCNQDLGSIKTQSMSTNTATAVQEDNVSIMDTASIFSLDNAAERADTPIAEQQELTCTTSPMDHSVIPTSFEVWPLSLDNYPEPTTSVATPGLFSGSCNNYHDEAWSDLLSDKATSEPPASTHMDPMDPSLMIVPGPSGNDSAIGSIDHCPSELADPPVIDPISLLSQIQLNLHGIQNRRPPQAAELRIIMNQTVQVSQKFIEVLNQILPLRTAEPSPVTAHQRQHTPYAPSVGDTAVLSKEDAPLHIEWATYTMKQPRRQQQQAQQQSHYASSGTVDTVEIRLALICYIQILRSYKNLVHMLVNSMAATETQHFELSDLVPVQIGTLHTVVSPRLQVALLVQLISQHTEEIRHKTRQLAARINEARPSMDQSHPGAFINNIIGKDIRGEEEDLRDGLDLISERLKMHCQVQDHRSLDR
ncbi:Zn2Cys6 transcriptional regulator [Trichoderma parareesei]|uniref:Zn2Cys6 transcriptional regulator n=1 Tax=Trichoderma parareesei TaxID=858221 RepID=A0A2H2ZLB4_TRIPA|nr:Zn2Cys6 transcriptional regulator [Trichoderma parareesei]